MSSPLRNQLLSEPIEITTASRHPAALQSRTSTRQKKMSLSQTYFLAHTARGKLSSEAARPDHNLRRLVGHANLLDALMVELHEAEREQEAWLEATVQSAQSSKPAGVKWVDREMALDIPDASDDEADSDDSDYEEEEEDEEFSVPIRRMRSPPPTKQRAQYHEEVDEADYSTDEDDEEFEDDDESDESLFLVRTQSHSPDSSHHISASSPEVPELISDSEPESDDDSSPSSPSIPELTYTAPAPLSKTPAKPLVREVYDDDFLHANRQNPMVAAF